MGEVISQVGVLPTTAGGILGLFCILIITGQIPTRRELRDIRADRDKWQASSETWQQVATQHGMTLEKLIDYAEAADHALTAIQTVVQYRAGEEPR